MGTREFIDTPDNVTAIHYVPADMDAIKKNCKFRNPFNHPSVMFKKNVILKCGNYDTALRKNEDYDLWYRVITNGYKCSNIQKTLVKFRSGRDFYKRRKDKIHYKGKLAIKKKMFKDHYTSFFEYVFSVGIEIIYYYCPFNIRKLAFRKGR